jgi:formate hydrogenlyase subunit 6/NADH:ubiquinone oxidoreductase subunit I
MTNNRRRLLVDAESCVGCHACSTLCPAGLIVLHDTGHVRTVRFQAVCAEDCILCVEACPVQAIVLQPIAGRLPEGETELAFELERCAQCGGPMATREMLARLRTVIPEELQVDAEEQAWLDLCPPCRQQAEARGVAREGILTRWPG